MKVIRSLPQYLKFIKTEKSRLQVKNRVLGFVPTMGALHAGHEALLIKARKECDFVVLSIFVNPTQFNNATDLKKYPNTLKKDLVLAKKAGVDCVWLPSSSDLYPGGYRYRVTENKESLDRCGAHRPGHFDGVLTVVLKLFQCTQPDRVYFGEKDRQQLELIQGMVKDFFLTIKVVPVPTVREKDGLAMSSRNVRLNANERIQATLFPKILKSGMPIPKIKRELRKNGFLVEYVTENEGYISSAVVIGIKNNAIRLIDNFKRGLKR